MAARSCQGRWQPGQVLRSVASALRYAAKTVAGMAAPPETTAGVEGDALPPGTATPPVGADEGAAPAPAVGGSAVSNDWPPSTGWPGGGETGGALPAKTRGSCEAVRVATAVNATTALASCLRIRPLIRTF